MKIRSLLTALLVACSPAAACAHFPFLHWTTLDDAAGLQVYFGESPAPDNPEFLDRLVDSQVWMKPAGGPAEAVEIKREGDFLLARPKVDGPVVFGLSKTWGEISRGDETFELLYYAKSYSDRAAWSIETGQKLTLDIRPTFQDGKLTATALWKNKPLAGAEIVVQGGLEHYEGKTNPQGQFACKLTEPALYAIRVRHVEDAVEDQPSGGRRHYVTATIQIEKPAE